MDKNNNFLEDKNGYFLNFFGSIDRLKIHINSISNLGPKNDIIFIYLFKGDVNCVKGTYNNYKLYFYKKFQCFEYLFYIEIDVKTDFKTDIDGFAFFKK